MKELTRGEKLRASNIKKYGSEEAWIAQLKIQGAKGGRAKVPKGFARDSQRAREAGRRGGKASRRHPTHFMLVDGKKVAVSDHARKIGVHYNTLLYRVLRDGGLV